MKNSKIAILSLVLCFSSILYSQSVSFIAFGDWGRDGKYNQKETAEQMGIYTQNNKTDFILTLGDNIYPTGVTSTSDSKWQTSFELIYTAPSLQIPWYVTIGNHDYGGSVQAEIDYSQISSRWKLPSRYYSFTQKIDDTTSALFVIIDSNPFIKSYLTFDKIENGELSENSVNDLRNQDTKEQLRWLDSILSSSNAKWKVVAGHHPVYSGGEHGNTPELIEQIEPVLEKNNVQLYLCGHDHDMQYLKKEGYSLNYFVAGTGSKLRLTGKTEYTVYSASENGFLAVTITNSNITASFIGLDGKELYAAIIR